MLSFPEFLVDPYYEPLEWFMIAICDRHYKLANTLRNTSFLEVIQPSYFSVLDNNFLEWSLEMLLYFPVK